MSVVRGWGGRGPRESVVTEQPPHRGRRRCSTLVRVPGTSTTFRCPRCDVLIGLDDVDVGTVERVAELLTVTIFSATTLTGCPSCGWSLAHAAAAGRAW